MNEVEGTKFISFNPEKTYIGVALLSDILNKVNMYAHDNGYLNVKLIEIEDQSWLDQENRRYDIRISYTYQGTQWSQLLLYLKGEIVDGEQFHKRFDEFYWHLE